MSSVQLSDEEISEFRIEAFELLDIAEASLLALDKGDDFKKHYDSIFRAFHSVKGAAGMFNWSNLQHHMHLLENHFQSCKEDILLSKARVSYFLNGVDATRSLLSQKEISFNYELPSNDIELEPNRISINKVIQAENEILNGKHPAKKEDFNFNVKVPIFVLDDEKDIVEILSEILCDAGFEVHGYTDAEIALKEVLIKKPQVFFSDMNMPELSGLEVLRELNKLDPDIPLVFVSAHLSKEILVESLSYGIYGAIEKPFSGKQIITMAKTAAKKYQLWRLLNRSMNLIMYQFSSLDNYLQEKGDLDYRNMMVNEMQALLEIRKKLKGFANFKTST